jgi:uncharacterized membrane protein YqjE
MRAENGNARMAEELRRLADALSRLVKEHFDLARAELRADATRWGQDLAVGFAAVPFAVLGLLLLDLALAALLSRAVGVPGALALIGVANLGIAAALGLLAARRMREARAGTMKDTAEELRGTRRALRGLGNGGGRRVPERAPGRRPGAPAQQAEEPRLPSG